MKNKVIKIIFIIILIVLAYFVYDMYQFVNGIRQDVINNKHKQMDGDFTIHKDSLFRDNSSNHLLDSIMQQEKDSANF